MEDQSGGITVHIAWLALVDVQNPQLNTRIRRKIDIDITMQGIKRRNSFPLNNGITKQSY